MKRKYFVALLPPFFDYPGNHSNDDGSSGGPGIFVIKILFRTTTYYAGYEMNKQFCTGLKKTIENFQKDQKIEVDGNFGQETRKAIAVKYGLELDRIPREMIEEEDVAIQPDGLIVTWP